MWPINHFTSYNHFPSYNIGKTNIIPEVSSQDIFLAGNVLYLKFLLVTTQAQLGLLINCFQYGRIL